MNVLKRANKKGDKPQPNTKKNATAKSATAKSATAPSTKPTPSGGLSILDERRYNSAVKAHDAFCEYLSGLLVEFRKVCPKITLADCLKIAYMRNDYREYSDEVRRAIVLANLDGKLPEIGGMTIPIERAIELVEMPDITALLATIGATPNAADMSYILAHRITAAPDGSATYNRDELAEIYTAHLTPAQADKYRYFEGLANTLNEYLNGGGVITCVRNERRAMMWDGLKIEYSGGLDVLGVASFSPDVAYIVGKY